MKCLSTALISNWWQWQWRKCNAWWNDFHKEGQLTCLSLYSWKDCIVEKEKPDASFMWRKNFLHMWQHNQQPSLLLTTMIQRNFCNFDFSSRHLLPCTSSKLFSRCSARRWALKALEDSRETLGMFFEHPGRLLEGPRWTWKALGGPGGLLKGLKCLWGRGKDL